MRLRFLFKCRVTRRSGSRKTRSWSGSKRRAGLTRTSTSHTRVRSGYSARSCSQKQKVNYWDDPKFPRFGTGRIDTFNSVKVLRFDWGPGDFVGTNDFPSVWNRRPRREWFMHWDGNNKKMEGGAEHLRRDRRRRSGPGTARIRTSAQRSTNRVWRGSRSGSLIFSRRNSGLEDRPVEAAAWRGTVRLALCGMPLEGRRKIGQVVPVTDPRLDTDRERLDSFTPELSDAMNTIGIGYPWQFQNFRKTDGVREPTARRDLAARSVPAQRLGSYTPRLVETG